MKDRRDVYILELQRELAGVNANRIEQIADQSIHLPAPAQRYFQQFFSSGWIQIVFQQKAGAGNYEVQWIAQVVSDDPKNLLACVRQQLGIVPFLTLRVIATTYFFIETLQLSSARFCQRSGRSFSRRRYASWTSAVGCSV